MRGQVRKIGSTWEFGVETPKAEFRRCTACRPKARGKHAAAGKIPTRGTRFRVEDLAGRDDCPACGAPLGVVLVERSARWSSKDSDGRTLTTRKAAEAALALALHRVEGGHDPIPRSVTLAEIAEQWFKHMAAVDRPRARQRHSYEKLVRQHCLSRIGGIAVRTLKPAHVQGCLDHYAEGRAPRTIAQLRASISSLFTYAVRGGVIEINPARATTVPTPREVKLRVPTEELPEIIEAARGTTWEIPVLIAATSGARRGEVLAVRWRHVDLDAGTVRITEGLQRLGGALVFERPKTDRARREIPLPAFAVERLRAHKADQARRRLALGVGWTDLDLVCERGDGLRSSPTASRADSGASPGPSAWRVSGSMTCAMPSPPGSRRAACLRRRPPGSSGTPPPPSRWRPTRTPTRPAPSGQGGRSRQCSRAADGPEPVEIRRPLEKLSGEEARRARRAGHDLRGLRRGRRAGGGQVPRQPTVGGRAADVRGLRVRGGRA
jgi:integrase